MKEKSQPLSVLPVGGVVIWGEYKSKRKLFGLPLLHIIYGPPFNPTTGKLRIAKGIIAIGGIAFGWLALGGVAIGLFSLGGTVFGLLAAIGGVAIGTGFSMGGIAIGTIAVGGCAIGYYAIGGAAFGAHAVSGNTQDPALMELLQKWGFKK